MNPQKLTDDLDNLFDLLEARKSRHGDFAIQSEVAQTLKYVVRGCDCDISRLCADFLAIKWDALSPPKREALDMILHKVARIMAGDAEFDDHWRDIAGYATRAQETCAVQTKPG